MRQLAVHEPCAATALQHGHIGESHTRRSRDRAIDRKVNIRIACDFINIHNERTGQWILFRRIVLSVEI